MAPLGKDARQPAGRGVQITSARSLEDRTTIAVAGLLEREMI